MRRLALLLLLLALPPIAVAQDRASAVPAIQNEVQLAPYLIAYPGDPAAAIQKAIDSAAGFVGVGGQSSGIVTIPSLPNNADGTPGAYLLARPIRTYGNAIDLRGDRRQPILKRNYQGPTLIVGEGYGDKVNGRPVNGHWVDLFGVLDASAAQAPGTRYGLRSYVPAISAQGTWTGGSFTLKFTPGGSNLVAVTPAIPWNASAAQVQTALEQAVTDAKSGSQLLIGAGNVACTGGPLPGTPITYTLNDATNAFRFNDGPNLDLNANGVTGVKPVVVCGQNLHVSFPASALSHPWNSSGANYKWSGVTAYSVDLAVKANWPRCRRTTAGGVNAVPLAGISDGNGDYAPWGLQTAMASPTAMSMTFLLDTATAADPYWKEKSWQFTATVDPTVPLQRISIQWDMSLGTIQFYVNGTKRTLLARRYDFSTSTNNLITMSGDTVPGLAGLKMRNNEDFAANVLASFGVGGANPDQDVTLLGFRASRDNRYNPLGTSQSRKDGQLLNDAYQFFGSGVDATILQLTDRPGSNFATTTPSGPATLGYGQVVVEGSTLLNYSRLDVEDLAFEGSYYGANVSLVSSMYGNFRRLKSTGGFYGLASQTGRETTYTTTITDCEFSRAGDAGLYTNFTFGSASRVNFFFPGRTAYLSRGAALNLKDVFVAPSGGGVSETLFKTVQTGNPQGCLWESISVDYEGGGPTDSHFSFESSPYQPGLFTLKNTNLGSVASNTAAIRLRGPGTRYPSAVFLKPTVLRVEGLLTLDSLLDNQGVPIHGTVIACDSANWYGSAEGLVGTPWKWNSGVGSVISYHEGAALPTTGAWEAGKHRWRHTAAVNSGDAIESYCKTSGDYAAAPSPIWAQFSKLP
jgi:hypothetical protein